MENRTGTVGAILEREYGHLSDQNVHIEYFFLILGTKLLGKRDEIIATLGGISAWDTLGKKGPQLLFSTGKCPKISLFETERQREERLNLLFRMPLLVKYADPNNPPHIIVSRACEYKTEPFEVVKNSLSTPVIESILRTPSDEHLDYFYLMITQHFSLTEVALPSSIILAPHIPGYWKAVEAEDNFPLTFFSYFPKKLFETEREREWRLHKEVRIPLKEYLKDKLIKQFQAQGIPLPEKLVSIVFTRACTYTNM